MQRSFMAAQMRCTRSSSWLPKVVRLRRVFDETPFRRFLHTWCRSASGYSKQCRDWQTERQIAKHSRQQCANGRTERASEAYGTSVGEDARAHGKTTMAQSAAGCRTSNLARLAVRLQPWRAARDARR